MGAASPSCLNNFFGRDDPPLEAWQYKQYAYALNLSASPDCTVHHFSQRPDPDS